jgi:hypothetical protein
MAAGGVIHRENSGPATVDERSKKTIGFGSVMGWNGPGHAACLRYLYRAKQQVLRLSRLGFELDFKHADCAGAAIGAQSARNWCAIGAHAAA